MSDHNRNPILWNASPKLYQLSWAVSSGDNLHNRQKVGLGRKNEIFYYSKKEDPKISRMAKFGGEML